MTCTASTACLGDVVLAAGSGRDVDPNGRLFFGVLGLLALGASWAALTGRWRSWVGDARRTIIAICGPGYALIVLPHATGMTDLPKDSAAYVLLAMVPFAAGSLWVPVGFVLAAVFDLKRPRWMQPRWLRRSLEPPRQVMIAKARRRRGARSENKEGPVEITAGQVWRYRTRPGEHASRAHVLLVEDDPELGALVHARLEGVCVSNPNTEGGVSTWLGHVPITRAAFEASVIAVVAADDDPPDLEGYRLWRDAHGGAFSKPLAEVVSDIEAIVSGVDS
ncbi:hypothetical protein [Actinomycetospora soli]|uniref:hypothetical protein n=1 Tax=Actinomycetospora soli TaxID=2893887 RepID=UPI001E332477|nr:hypothetical protein [Actinomycetospora soli]MCD2191246.1 hypothetical protein [Actinomycetospora soli]